MLTSKTHTHDRVSGKEIKMNNFGSSLEDFYEKDVVCLRADNTVLEAAKLMLEHHVGNIVITDSTENAKKVPVGIITDRDIVLNSIAKDLAPEFLKLSDIMTDNLVTVTEGASLSDLVQLFTEEGVSRLPVVDDSGELKGILSSKRLFQYFAQGLCELSSLSSQREKRESH